MGSGIGGEKNCRAGTADGARLLPSNFSRTADKNHAVNAGAVAESDFAFGGMDVHIHILRRHGDQQDRRGMAARLGQAAIRLAEGVLDETIADRPAVEEEELILRHWPGQFGQSDQADDGYFRVARLQREVEFREILRPGGEPSRRAAQRLEAPGRFGRCESVGMRSADAESPGEGGPR